MPCLIGDANIFIDMEACPLLTGDRILRKAARAERVEVRGTLWLMETLVVAGTLDASQATSAYELMRQNGRRLPWAMVSAQLAKLNQESTPDP